MSEFRPIHLGVNVDHVATLRQARGTRYPDPVMAAQLAEQAGADSITIHLREDRRHVQERDLELMMQALNTHVNLEMAVTEAMLALAVRVAPRDCCLVPERRQELTTEGGLDVSAEPERIRAAVGRLQDAGIRAALFVDPEPAQIEASRAVGAAVIELHTGSYAEASTRAEQLHEIKRIRDAAALGVRLGLTVHAGHGLNYHNVQSIAAIDLIEELNIGHAIIARALFDGLPEAVARMKALMVQARRA